MLLQYGGWDDKIRRHNEQSAGRMTEAVRTLSEGLGWMGGGSVLPHGHVSDERQNVRQQLFSGAYGTGMGGGNTGIRTGLW